MQFVDKPFGSDVPIVSPENAFMSGALKTDNLDDLRRFERTFPLNPNIIMGKALEMRDFYQKRGSLPTAKEKMDILFVELVPKVYVAANGAGWNAVIHFKIDGASDYTVKVANGTVTTSEGLVGTATCTVTAHYETWRKLLRYELLEDSGQVPITKLQTWQDEESVDKELSDEMLESVAGGKGCGAEAAAGQACGKDSCGAAAGAGNACGAAACGAAGGVGGVCGAAACGAAVGGGTVCGGAACGADACGGAACGAAACGAAACGAAACGGDAGVGACAGNVCGAAVGAGVCAGNVCGVDVLGGADVGPCAVNVIPCVPGC